MLKTKMMFGLITLVMVLALAQTGFSQLSISATSSPNATANATGFTEPAFNPNGGYGGITITGSVLSDAPFTGGRLRITFPSAITNACTLGSSGSSTGCNATADGPGQNVPGSNITSNPGVGNSYSTSTGAYTAGVTNSGIQLTLANGIFQGAVIAAVSGPGGTIDITLPCATATNLTALSTAWGGTGGHIQGTSGTIILTGARIDATTASGLPAGPAAAALSINTGSSAYGIPNTAYGGGGTAECPQTSAAGGNTGAGANVTVATSSVNIISATAAGIGAVAGGGIPSSVSAPGTSSASNGGVTGSQATTFNGATVCTTTGGAFYINCGAATVYTNKSIPKGLATFTVKEGFAYAWYHNDSNEFNGQDLLTGGNINTTDAAFSLTFNNVPTGVTLALAVASFTGSSGPSGVGAATQPTVSLTAAGTGSASVNITSTNNVAYVHWGGDLSTSSTDWVTFEITGITVSSSATLSPGSVTVTANMTPTAASALTGSTGVSVLPGTGTTLFPSFATSAVSGPAVVNIVPANTTMLIPYAVVCCNGYNTGIAIANTSVDPFGIGTVAQPGNVTVTLFPAVATGTASSATAVTGVSFTTSPTKVAGSGIAADGNIPAGSTWAVNLSDLLNLAGMTGTFSGYIFIQANFLPAHGVAYVYNGAGFTSSTPVLVMPPPSTSGRSGNNASLGAEVLDF